MNVKIFEVMFVWFLCGHYWFCLLIEQNKSKTITTPIKMLSPQVWDFSAPKVMITHKENQDLPSVCKVVNMNHFYNSLIITCPDESNTPSHIQDVVIEDSDYYKLTQCSLTEFVEPAFIENFVENGSLYCLSTDRNCIVQNCAAITPDGELILHILDYIYQTLRLEGTKRPYNYYEVRIDLKSLKNHEKVKSELSKLELFNFHIIWEPSDDNICPSSIAKYFNDRSVHVSVLPLKVTNILPTITEVPSIKNVDIDEMVEWLGLLAHNVDFKPKDSYISTYSPPDSENSLKTSRISVFIAKGFIPPSLINKVCLKLSEYVMSRELEHFWASLSIQSDENSLYRWNASAPRMFQAHDSSCNLFFTHSGHVLYSIGQLKYS